MIGCFISRWSLVGMLGWSLVGMLGWSLVGMLGCVAGCQGQLLDVTTPPETDAASGFDIGVARAPARVGTDEAPVPGVLLGLPLVCTPGDDCAVAYYFNYAAKGQTVADYACGGRALDGSQATTFVLRDARQMAEGVAVVAADAGEVVGLDDDASCGVGVTLDHGRRWATRYCHLLPGSLEVALGDLVGRGQRLGNVGQSGDTQNVAQLALEVLHNGQRVDPFTGSGLPPTCGDSSGSLWTAQVRTRLPYAPQLIQIGFVGKQLDVSADGAIEQLRADIFAGSAASPTISAEAPAILLYAQVLGLEQGDSFRARILDPDREEIYIADWQTVARNWVVYTHVSGRQRGESLWPPGEYTGEVEIRPHGAAMDSDPIRKTTSVQVVQ